jgi:L-ascorbate metabolism protein UlaG (beta-lactamase superfamily)
MDITYYGHSCFRIRGSHGTVVTDPFSEATGYYELPRVAADICTISHNHAGHNYGGAVLGNPYIISGPGEYEVSGIFVYGWPSYHDGQMGQVRGRNTIYTFEIDGFTVAHLGDLGHVPSKTLLEGIGDVDVLLTPVGGDVTLTAAMASDVISLIEPHLVIPMHYRTAAYTGPANLDPLAKFLKEMGAHNVQPETSLRASASSLPDETRIVVLKYRGGPSDA